MRQPIRLRVMTFNIHGGRPAQGPANLEAIARVIAEAQPDLVGLQEVHQYLPPPCVFQNQPREFQKLLRMEVCFLPSISLGPCGYGNAILARSRPERLQRIRLPSSWETRALLEAHFEREGRSFRFLNTHLGLGCEERMRQFSTIAERLRDHAGPVIVLGDWNARPASEELRLLEEGTSLVHCAAPEVCTYPGDAPELRLDYIMVTPHFEIEDCRVIDTQVSDHRPMIADLILK